MLSKSSDVQKALLFTGLVLALVTVFSILLPDNAQVGVLAYVPLLVVLITMLITGEMFTKKGWASLGFHRFSLKGVLIGLAIPIIPTVIGYALVWSTGLGTFAIPAEDEGKLLEVLLMAVVTLIIFSLTQLLGEEIGWRGYLLPRLQSLGTNAALLISGFIWGLFHLPAIVFTGGYHADTNFWIFIPLFMLNVTLAGVFIGYLRLVTGSIWTAILAHGAHNMIWHYGARFTTDADGIVNYLTGDVGIFGIVFYGLVYLFIRKDIKKRKFIATTNAKSA